jgi:hypothetical protein
MTRTSSSIHNRSRQRNAFDRFYHSFSTEFWLATASAIVIFNWLLHPSSGVAAFLMLAGAGLGGFALYSTNSRIAKNVGNFMRKYGNNGAWLLFLGLVVGITVFNYATSPSSALILTNSGVATLQNMVSGTSTSAAAATAGTGSGTAVGSGIINNVIIIFRILFFIGFMWALYRAYDKYAQQAELLDVIQTPIVLIIVVGIIDGAAAIFLGP